MADTWGTIAKTPLIGVYIHELFWLAADVVNRGAAIFDRTPPPQELGSTYIKVEPELHADIYAMLGSAAKIRALITQRAKRRDQTGEAHTLLRERSRALANLLDGLGLEVILSANVRHSLEHFDERIDSTAEAIVKGSTPTPVHIPLDLAVWNRDALEVLKGSGNGPAAELVLLRVYLANERVFVNAHHEINLGNLWEEAKGVTERLEPMMGDATKQGRGGSVFVVAEIR